MDAFVLQAELRFPLHSSLTEDLINNGSLQCHLQKRRGSTLLDWPLMGKAQLCLMRKTKQRNVKWLRSSITVTESACLKQADIPFTSSSPFLLL